ncbi:MAG: hypothetical protein ACOCSK_03055 [Rhodothermales bacterium]
MAKIDVERKGGTPAWVWVVAILVIVLLVLALWALLGDRDEPVDDLAPDQTEEVAPTDDVDRPSELEDLGAFVREGDERYDVGLEHEYANEGLHSVADAIDALAERRDVNGQIASRTDTVRARADRLLREEEVLRHADFVREAGVASAEAMDRLQQQGYQGAGADIDAVREAARRIDPETQLLGQRQAMRDFFERAHQALDRMSGHAPERQGNTGS